MLVIAACGAFALPASSWPAGSEDAAPDVTPEMAIQQQLHARRPDVLRWEITPVSTRADSPDAGTAVRLVGTPGPRIAVRFGDGRVRWYSVRGLGAVLVSKRVVAVGEPLAGGDLVPAERDPIALGCTPLASLDASRRWRASRRLAAQQALCTHSLEPMPDVERGGAVTLSTSRGPITVSRVLVAANDARMGERVRLRDPDSGDVVAAIVTGAGAARGLTTGE